MTERDVLPGRREMGIVLLLVLAGILLRVVFPGADAIHPRWHGWVTDEGRWTELAREWALFRAPDLDSPLSRIHLVVAPLFQGVVALTFEMVGVGLEAARLPSRIAGIALLGTAVVALRRALTPRAWVVMAALVAVHPELVYLSRVAIPEMCALLAGFVAFLLVVRPEASPRTDVVAGVVTALAVGFKGTTALYVPAFALAILVIGPPRDGRSPWARLLPWGAGLVLPALVVLAAAAVTVGVRLPGRSGAVASILAFVEFTGFYDMGTTFLRGESLDDVNLVLAVLCPLVVAVALRDPPDSRARRVHRGALAWAAPWIGALTFLEYFPPRYVVHLHLALILASTAAVSLLGDPRGRSLAQGWASWTRGRRVAAGAAVALPLAVVLVPALLTGLDAVGPRLDRIRVVGPLLLVVALGVGWAGARRSVDRVFGAPILVFPLVAAVIWRGIHGPAVEVYWLVDASTEFLPWLLAVLGGALVAWVVGRTAPVRPVSTRLASGAVVYLTGLMVLWAGIRHGPTLASPSYELAGLSQALTERYPPGEVIGVSKLTTALIDTPFRYREVADPDLLPDAVVTTIWSPDLPPRAVSGAGFRTVAEFEMPVFLFRGHPRPADQPLFFDRMPVELLERDEPGRADPG